MERVRFIEHRSRRLLLLDFSYCRAEEVLKLIEDTGKIIRVEPPRSLLTLTDVTGTKYNMDVTQTMKEFTNGNKPHIRAAAVVGIDGLKKIVYEAIMRFSERNVPIFSDIEKAKDWLVEQ
jgi:hypothetical protein